MGQFERCIPSAAKAVLRRSPFIAAVNRCATQKARTKSHFSASRKAVPFQNRVELGQSPANRNYILSQLVGLF
jgi:hypothetical protein